MNDASPVFPGQPVWDSDGTHRIPFAAYTSEELHRRELERFFYQGHWCYVGLEAEVPNPGDFKRTAIG
jgi:salicylate 5-hydroxylase large subunit